MPGRRRGREGFPNDQIVIGTGQLLSSEIIPHGLDQAADCSNTTCGEFSALSAQVAIAVIVLLQAADSYREAVRGDVRGEVLHKSWLTTGFMIAYVYIAGLLLIFVAKAAIRAAVELVARSNACGLRNAIARNHHR